MKRADGATAGQPFDERVERVAILGENQRRLADAIDQPRHPANLRRARACLDRDANQILEHPDLFGAIRQARQAQQRRGRVAITLVDVVPGQRLLGRCRVATARDQVQAPRQRAFERGCA